MIGIERPVTNWYDGYGRLGFPAELPSKVYQFDDDSAKACDGNK